MSSTKRKPLKGSGSSGVLTGRRKRQETLLSIRKAKKEDAYATRRNLKSNLHVPSGSQDATYRQELLKNIATRSHALLLGIQHKDPMTRQKSMRAFVYLLSSGVPPLFDESHSQHAGLWKTILAAVPFFIGILHDPLTDATSVQIHADAAFALRFIASMDKAKLLLDAGVVPKLMEIFQSGISELQVQAAWCLGNIAGESAPCCESIVQACPPSAILAHIRLATPALRRAAVWLLRSLIEFPEVMEQFGALPSAVERETIEILSTLVVQLADEKSKQWQAGATAAAAAAASSSSSSSSSSSGHDPTDGKDTEFNFDVRQTPALAPWRVFEVKTGNPAPNDIAVVRFVRQIDQRMVEVVDVDVNFESGEHSTFLVEKNSLIAMPVVDDALSDDEGDVDEEDDSVLDEKMLTLCDSCWALVELNVQDSDILSGMVNLGLCAKLVQVLYFAQNSVILTPVLRLLGNIVSADVAFAQAVIDARLLQVMPTVLMNTSRSVREEACWMLSNIAGGQLEQVTTLVNSPGVLGALVEQLCWAEYAVKREATWAICNVIVRTSVDCIRELVRMGVLRNFGYYLEDWEDPMAKLVMLEALVSLLEKDALNGKIAIEENEVLRVLEDLCYDENETISEMSMRIMDTWFASDTDQDSGTNGASQIAPAIVDNTTSGSASTSFAFQPSTSEVQFNFSQSS